MHRLTLRLGAAMSLWSLASLGLSSCLLGSGSPDPAPQPDVESGGPGPTRSLPMQRVAGTTYEAAAQVELPQAVPEDHDVLHNVFDLGDNIISGSEPYGPKAFEILRDKGVRTILSVDGKAPDAELAAEYGLTYVHVPIQYKGITHDEVRKITKTFREQEGPFYVHCFHGKHRGPAAAALGRLVLDGVPRETAIGEMRQWCGTSPSYEGLYSTVAYTSIPSAAETEAMDWDFPSAEPLDGIAGAMVVISRPFDHLKAASKNGWQPDPGHPDLNPFNEATKLAGHLERTLAMTEVMEHDEEYRGWMQAAKEQTSVLRELIGRLEADEVSANAVDHAYRQLSKTCSDCHSVYRN